MPGAELCAPCLIAKEKQWNADLLAAAREDFNVFCELAAVDDETQEPIKQATIHHKWAALCDKYDRLIIWSHISSGKTNQLSIFRTVWELGRDPSLRFVILSNTSSIATKIVKSIASLIKNNAKVKEIFPGLVPDPDGPWTNTELQVLRKGSAKDPSVRAVGVHGSLTSARVDRLIVDDILDPENTDTEAKRKSLEAWYKSVATTRITRRGKILVVGTAYHPKDLLHTLAANKKFKWFRFPIVDAEGKITWPEEWPPERIERMREELGPAEYSRSLLCLARDDDAARFKQDWIDAAIARGEGLRLVHSLADLPGNEPEDIETNPYGEMPEGCSTFTGVDLATGKKTNKRRGDDTVFFTFLQKPNGDRLILNIEIGKYKGPEIVQKINDHHVRYASTVIVEDNQAQDFILQFAREGSNVPVVPFTTTKRKHDPILGVEGLAIELFNGKWIIPSEATKVAPHVDRFISEMLFFSPKAHTGDVLMAVYFAREYARKLLGNVTAPAVTLRIIGAKGSDDGSGGGSDGGSSGGGDGDRGFLSRLFDTPKK